MKRKWIFGILTVLMISLIFSISQGADKFYYGGFHVQDLSRKCPELRDSLRFNLVFGKNLNDYIDSLANASLQGVAEQERDESSPTHWSCASRYTLWEAEGFPGSNWNLQYNGGSLVDDPDASGGKAMQFGGPAAPQLIQWGPSYYQERGPEEHPIQYTAEFRLKYLLNSPRGAMVPKPPADSLCRIMVVDSGVVLNYMKIYKRDFPGVGGTYDTFTLEYTVPNPNQIDFQIYWFGNAVLYVDYVKVYDDFGRQLIDDTTHLVANQIKAYVNQSWVHTTIPETGDTVVYRWLLGDQPRYIDCYKPYAYIDSLLRDSLPHIPGAQFTCYYSDRTILIDDYLLRSNPIEYMIDAYAFHADDTTESNIQQSLNWLTEDYNYNKGKADSLEKDFWVAIQAHLVGYKKTGPCNPDCKEYLYNGTVYCYYLKDPTPNEVRVQTFLAMCYGADAVMNYRISDSCDGNYLETGLYDQYADTATQKWEEIKNFTGPRVEKLGPIIKDLTWLGACPDDSVGSFILRNEEPSYIHNIVPLNHFPPYVEVGFFKSFNGYSDYFMLVNRRCLSSEGDSFRIFIEIDPGWEYCVEDMYSGSDAEIPRCGYFPEFTVFLEPGEGKLFKLYPWYGSWHKYRLVPQEYATIQEAIDSAGSQEIVLVDTGTYHENIEFREIGILVTSKFHTTGDTSYISRTIIDGSCPAHSDSASVVRFVSGENSCACIKGFTLRNGAGTLYSYKGVPAKCGGGIYCDSSSPTISDNIIISNHVSGEGGGICCNFKSSPKIINNIIKGNSASYGGGISGGGPRTIIANNLIVSDTASCDGGGIEGAFGIIANNTMDRNSAFAGGGIYVLGITCRIVNNIIANSLSGGGIYFAVYPDSTISYNNVWNNDGGNFVTCPSGVGDTTWGTNRNGTPCDSFYNIIRDPLFVDGYHLDITSPCIEAGNNNAPGLPATDFEGNRRVVDGNQDDSFFVDMGAYEYQTGGYGGFAKIVGGDRKDTETRSSSVVPDKFSLLQNYPNPFNPTTVVKFEIVQPAMVSLKIYNILGRLVKVLVDEEKVAGTYTAYWDGKDQNGQPVSSGIYFYKLDTGNFTEVKKMALIK